MSLGQERFVAAIQAWPGRAVLWAFAALLVGLHTEDGWDVMMLVGAAACFAHAPRTSLVQRGWLLLLLSQSINLVHILNGSTSLTEPLTRVLRDEQWEALSPSSLLALGHVGFLGLAWAHLAWARHRPQAWVNQHPLLTWLAVGGVALVVAAPGWASGSTRVWAWLLVLMVSRNVWFLMLALLDQRSAQRSPDALQLGTFHPFWGGSSLPYGKGAALLRKVQAQTPADLALTQYKGLKLGLWSLGLLFLERGLTWWLEDQWGLRQVEDEVSAFLSQAGRPLWLQWGSVLWSQFDYALWIAAWGNGVIALGRLAGLRLPRASHRPLESRTMIDYFNRVVYYFKELLVDVFFTPSFFRYFKAHPRLRLFFATFMAAGVGNALYHFVRDVDLLPEMGLQALFVSFHSYLWYSLVLALAIGWSQVRILNGIRPPTSVGGRLRAFVIIWGFVSLMRIFGDESRSHDLGERLQFLIHLFGA